MRQQPAAAAAFGLAVTLDRDGDAVRILADAFDRAAEFDGETGISWPKLEKALYTYLQRKTALNFLHQDDEVIPADVPDKSAVSIGFFENQSSRFTNDFVALQKSIGIVVGLE